MSHFLALCSASFASDLDFLKSLSGDFLFEINSISSMQSSDIFLQSLKYFSFKKKTILYHFVDISLFMSFIIHFFYLCYLNKLSSFVQRSFESFVRYTLKCKLTAAYWLSVS